MCVYVKNCSLLMPNRLMFRLPIMARYSYSKEPVQFEPVLYCWKFD